MSAQPQNEKRDGTRGSEVIINLPPKPLTPEQGEKVKGGLRASVEDRIAGN